MSDGRKHIIFGLIVVVLTLFITDYFLVLTTTQKVLYVAIGVMFSVWPDVDVKSMGQKLFYFMFFFADCYLIFMKEFKIAAYLGLIIILPILSRHRGWTHSKITMILLPLPLLLYPMYTTQSLTLYGLPYYIAAVVGYFSHLLFDGMIEL